MPAQKTAEFTQLSKAWYGEANFSARGDRNLIDEVYISVLNESGQEEGSLNVVWTKLKDNQQIVNLNSSSSWGALSQSKELLKLLDELLKLLDELDGLGDEMTPDFFCRQLEGIGMKDATPTKNPYMQKANSPAA